MWTGIYLSQTSIRAHFVFTRMHIWICVRYRYIHAHILYSSICKQGSTGWRKPIGCLKLQIIFRKRATKYRAVLRKMTYKDKASYASSPPCISRTHPFVHISYSPVRTYECVWETDIYRYVFSTHPYVNRDLSLAHIQRAAMHCSVLKCVW